MAISDGQFRAVVLAGGAVLALALGATRFCGGVALPPALSERAAPAESEPRAGAHDVRSASAASPAMYQDFLARDAAAAGIAAPTASQMARKLPYRVDEARHVLEVGQRPIEIAGVKLSAVRAGDAIALEIRNATPSDLAYRVVSEPAPEGDCGAPRPLPLNAMVVGKQQRETRVECVWREDLAIAVTRVETIELPPLSAWYVSQVPPTVVGIEDRIARGHRGPDGAGACTSMMSGALKSGLENGEIGWRDLVDFYARHRCQTYQFPLSYRALTKDGQKPLPVMDSDG